jgi:hypothetical protein
MGGRADMGRLGLEVSIGSQAAAPVRYSGEPGPIDRPERTRTQGPFPAHETGYGCLMCFTRM